MHIKPQGSLQLLYMCESRCMRDTRRYRRRGETGAGVRHATIPIHPMEACHYSNIHIEACHYSNISIEACYYSNIPIEACHYSNIHIETCHYSIIPIEACHYSIITFKLVASNCPRASTTCLTTAASCSVLYADFPVPFPGRLLPFFFF